METPQLGGRLINNVKVHKIRLDNKDKTFRGQDIIPERYPNIFILGKKKSGKSFVIYNILQKILSKKAKIIIIASTAYRDELYKKMRERLKKRGIDAVFYTSNVISKDETVIGNLAANIGGDSDECSDDDLSADSAEITEKPEELIIIFDDLGAELNSKIIADWMKKNRHYHATNIISSQYWNDLNKQGRLQLDIILLFPAIPEDKLKEVWKDSNLAITWEKFNDLYSDATKKRYNFLYIDVRNEKFRRNFDYEYNT